jgi:archaemetzincin
MKNGSQLNLHNITLFSFGYFERDLMKVIAENVEQEFNIEVLYRDGHLDLSDFYDAIRRQYNANNLLKVIDLKFSSDTTKTIGLFNVDLYIPILTYIFGQAFLNGRSGIASLYRLSNERYGMKKDDNLLLERFKKEVIHELGHTFGLIHCQNSSCVMRSSTYVEDIDQKTKNLCITCREILKF